MTAQPPFASYAEFTTAVVSLVAPLLPGDLDAKMRFSGSYGEWGWPSSDSATLRGKRALFLERLAAKTEGITGVDSSLYKTRLGPASLKPLLDHSAYARNIRRWEKGTLPRKAKARADFVLVAACWLLSWGEDESRSGRAATARGALCRWVGLDRTWGANDQEEILEALWHASVSAYRASLESRRAGGL